MSTVSRGAKGEKKVITALHKMSAPSYLINDFTFIDDKNQNSHQIDHIYIHPHGIFVIETKNYYGEVVGSDNGDLWYKIINGEKTIISNPVSQNKSHCYLISLLFNKKYKPISVVVYTKNNAPYLDDENVINLEDLPLFIDSFPYDSLLEENEMKGIYNMLMKRKAYINKHEHIENVKGVKERKNLKREEMRFAIEERRCPKCGEKLEINGYTYYCNKCKYKFTL